MHDCVKAIWGGGGKETRRENKRRREEKKTSGEVKKNSSSAIGYYRGERLISVVKLRDFFESLAIREKDLRPTANYTVISIFVGSCFSLSNSPAGEFWTISCCADAPLAYRKNTLIFFGVRREFIGWFFSRVYIIASAFIALGGTKSSEA